MKKSIILLMMVSFILAAPNSGGLENALDISTSGVVAQSIKMNVIAQNIANLDTIKTEHGTPYKKKVAIMKPIEYFSSKSVQQNVLNGVRVVRIAEQDFTSSNRVYDPNHPEADAQGYVYYPNIDLTKEIVGMKEASSAFEANVVAYNTTKAMMQASLEIGK
jgi:flagellar basal-body rod protein FlgC